MRDLNKDEFEKSALRYKYFTQITVESLNKNKSLEL
jgi:hypothetical protein